MHSFERFMVSHGLDLCRMKDSGVVSSRDLGKMRRGRYGQVGLDAVLAIAEYAQCSPSEVAVALAGQESSLSEDRQQVKFF